MLNFAKDLSAALDALRRHAMLFLLAIAVIAVALLTRSYLDARDATARLSATLAAQQKTISDADQRQSTRDAQLTQTLSQITNAKQKVQTPSQAAAALPQAVSQLIAEGPSGKPLPSPITIAIPSASEPVARVLEPGAVPPNSKNQTGIVTPQQGSSAQQFSTSTTQPNSPPSTSSTALENSLGNLSAAQEGTICCSPGRLIRPRDSRGQSPQPPAQLSVSTAAQPTSPPSSSAPAQTTTPPPAIITVPQDDLKPLYDAVQDCRACQAKLAASQADLTDERTKFAAATAQRDAAISAARGTFWKRSRTAAKWIVIGAAAGALLSRYH